MLDSTTKRRIDTARDILVGKVPDPKSQVEQITIALIYKFMDDMDAESEELGGKRKFFTGDYARYGWAKLMRSGLGGHETLALYSEGITKMPENAGLPPLFRDIFKNAYLPYRDPETLRAFLKIIDEFTYDHSERLGDAFEYLLSVLGSQGDAGQFRTPRHIIDFMVALADPRKDETVLDPACGTAGFLISAYKHILRNNSSKPSPQPSPSGRGGAGGHYRGGFDFAGLKKRACELRKSQTEAEGLLWELLRDRQLLGAKFRRQHQFGDYICDLYCHDANLVVECDGEVHATSDRKKIDHKRDAYLRSQGLNVLRFTNAQVLNDTSTVLDQIAAQISPPSPPGRGAGGEGVGHHGDLLTPEEKGRLARNFKGYDISPDMVRLSLVNLYLHGFTDPHIHEYDTLTSEERWNEFADVILANPPFMSPKGGIKPHKRFSIQAKRSEVLFVDYIAEHLKPGGRAAIIVPEGIIFQSQTAYKELRKLLVDQSLVAVISLPAGCFNPYSGVKTSILLLDKDLAPRSDTIAFFKVENDGFGLGAQRRAIDKNDLPQVQADVAAYLDALRDERSADELQLATALIVSKDKIAANGDYNLSGERYQEGAERHTTFPVVQLGEAAEVVAGQSPPGDSYNESGKGVPFYQGKTEFGDIFIGPPKTWTTDPHRFADTGDVLMSVRAPVGPVNIATQRICIGRGLAAIKPAQDRLLPTFAFYLLRSQEEHIKGDAGAVFPSINRSDIQKIQIPLPPLEVQQQIMAEIEGYQKVINGARAVIDNYRPHIPIDPEWPSQLFAEACSTITPPAKIPSSDYSPTGRFPIIDQSQDEIAGWTDDENALIDADGGLVIFGDHTCAVKYVSEKFAQGADGIKIIKPDKSLNPRFLYFYLLSNPIEQDGYKRHFGKLKETKVALPPLTTQRAIVAEIEAEQALVAANRELIARMEKKIQATLARVWGDTPAAEPAAFTPALLAKAFRGEL